MTKDEAVVKYMLAWINVNSGKIPVDGLLEAFNILPTPPVDFPTWVEKMGASAELPAEVEDDPVDRAMRSNLVERGILKIETFEREPA